MTEERDNEQAGAPVEQDETTDTQVLAAVERAAEVPAPETSADESEAVQSEAAARAGDEDPVVVPDIESTAPYDRPVIAAPVEPPSASRSETAEEIFAAHTPHRGVPVQPAAPVTGAAAGAASAVSAEPAAAPAPLPPVRDGEIRISADHPMAALYMQTPMPPEVRGNRGAGVLIALLATLAFAIVYAGVLALWQAPNFPPSTFLNDGLLPWVLSWGFAGAALGFFLGLALLVLIFGRAGWWAYAIGGLLVALTSWALSVLGFALDAQFAGDSVSFAPFSLAENFGLFLPTIAAAIVGREVAVWFGAWIGSRGRKVKRLNAEALTEYEKAMSEVQAKQP